MKLECPDYAVIQINSAVYGRYQTGEDVCPGDDIAKTQDTGCKSHNSFKASSIENGNNLVLNNLKVCKTSCVKLCGTHEAFSTRFNTCTNG